MPSASWIAAVAALSTWPSVGLVSLIVGTPVAGRLIAVTVALTVTGPASPPSPSATVTSKPPALDSAPSCTKDTFPAASCACVKRVTACPRAGQRQVAVDSASAPLKTRPSAPLSSSLAVRSAAVSATLPPSGLR